MGETIRFDQLGKLRMVANKRSTDGVHEFIYANERGKLFMILRAGRHSKFTRLWERGIPCRGWWLKPLTRAEAIEWVQENLDASEFNRIYWEMVGKR